MELKRDIYKELINWKNKNTGRVLELEEARQVGKTYILLKFAKDNYNKSIYINMAEQSGKNFLRCVSAVTEWKLGERRQEYSLHKAIKLYDSDFKDNKDTVIIIDEIQESSETYNYIRTFAREFQSNVIVTGSYLGKTIQPEFFLPAGDTDRLIMESLTFHEFLDVFGERELYEKIDLFGKGKPESYQKLMQLYEIYQKIGGYPAVVVAYAEYKDLKRCYEIIKALIEVFVNESKRYFTDIIDVNLFYKLFNAIALLTLKEKQGIRDLTTELSKIAYQDESGRMTKK